MLYLHNNKIAQSLQLNGSYGDTVEELAGLNGETLVACAPRLFGSGECERLISTSSSSYCVLFVQQQLLLTQFRCFSPMYTYIT